MKQSLTLIPTMREVPSDIEVKSYKMLLRAGFLKPSTYGVYSYLPLAKRLLTKIENIVREEIEALGAIEISLSTLQSHDIWELSERIHHFKDELFTLTDKDKRDLLLAPSHEEVVTMLVRDEIKTYKKLPLILYQIQMAYRDEKKSRTGLLRSREFYINDIYSFHENEESLSATYERILQAYTNILNRLRLNYHIVDADSGIKGEIQSQEFIIPSEFGDTIIVKSNESNYVANIEVAKVTQNTDEIKEVQKSLEKVSTPEVKTIKDLCLYFNISPESCIKMLVYVIDDEFVVVLVRGDHQVNEFKLKKVHNATFLRLATEDEIIKLLDCSPGSIGPIKLPINIKVYADFAIQTLNNAVTGANEEGYHYMNVNPERDFAINTYADLRYIKEGEISPDGVGITQYIYGHEIGRVIKLGTFFSEKFNANFVDENDNSNPILMGSYQLGVSRLLAILAEKYQDDNGFVWPTHLSPYDIHLIPINREDEVQWNLSTELYNILSSYHFDVLFDDRHESPGVKFTDADLIGLPVRVMIGKRANEGIVEVKIRSTGETFEWAKEELIDRLNEFFRTNSYN
ncbi:proline--tRNA ligase [Ureibacillus endophyticus]|uniref:Proline--tRNA ligase n=1 Tax=Ureibacillus endophyticus TaxID=1978490 RepID=A0A494ZAV3_9BACL|nr:proline--tRNA ligase [Lysinibacillus endophyticus]RKQ19830.1 proline--tRNA ligase [Lysinibacillus endophyticus]